ncbi:MAG TPA: hypothetical protein VGR73_00525 [Bryobacteraceae bacterium]|nr:hypothetical protein [Bryobacteraceae bacterium]
MLEIAVLRPKSKCPLAYAWRRHQALDNRVHGGELTAVLPLLPLKFQHLVGQFLVRGEHFAEPNEHPHDEQIHLNRAFALEHGGKHHHAMFGKGVRLISASASLRA